MLEIEYFSELGTGADGGIRHRFVATLWDHGQMYRGLVDLIVYNDGRIDRLAPSQLLLNHLDYTKPVTDRAVNLLRKKFVGLHTELE